jgi:hypothetical protein
LLFSCPYLTALSLGLECVDTTNMRIKTDLSYLNKLVRQLLTNSAVGFVALAVIITLMSALLQYRVVPVLMRQLGRSTLGGINQIYSLPPLAAAYQAPIETAVPDVQIALAEPVIPPAPVALSLPVTRPNDNSPKRLSAIALHTSAKILRTVEKETLKAARVAEAGRVKSFEKTDQNDNNEYSRGQLKQSEKDKRDSSRHNNRND